MANTFAPAFRVSINGTAVPRDVSNFVVQLSVVDELDGADQFSLTLANPAPKMPWTHTADADLFRIGNAVVVSLGYADDLQPMITGEITRLSPDFPESGTPTLTVVGHTRAHLLQKGLKTRTFQDITDKQIVERIASEAKLTPEVDETGTKFPYVIQYNRTDWAFLLERARRIHFEVVVEDKTLKFHKAKQDDGTVRVLEYGKNLKSFQPVIDPQKQVTRVVVRGYDPQKKKAIEGKAGPGDEESKMGGKSSGIETAGESSGTVEEVRVDHPVASQEEADQLARAYYNEILQDLVRGSGSAVGDPSLRAGRVVDLGGMGPLYNGRYYLVQVTHALGSGGYVTSFNVRRPSLG